MRSDTPDASMALTYPRLYRAFIGADHYGTERTAFVEASSHRAAIRKIANAVAALDMRLPETVEARIYNCLSARMPKHRLLDNHAAVAGLAARR